MMRETPVSESESEESVNNKYNKRFAKNEDELQQDILDLFKRQSNWTMDEIKHQMPDQPDKPVEQQVKKLCETQGGQSGRNAKYVLKDTYKWPIKSIDFFYQKDKI